MKLSELIREAWGNACDNGYESELRSYDESRLTQDFMDYDAYISEYEFDHVLDEVTLFIRNGYK